MQTKTILPNLYTVSHMLVKLLQITKDNALLVLRVTIFKFERDDTIRPTILLLFCLSFNFIEIAISKVESNLSFIKNHVIHDVVAIFIPFQIDIRKFWVSTNSCFNTIVN